MLFLRPRVAPIAHQTNVRLRWLNNYGYKGVEPTSQPQSRHLGKACKQKLAYMLR